MKSKIEEFVRKKLEEINELIKEDMKIKGLDASGTASKSLNVRQRGLVLSSVGADYFEYINRGRPPGKYPPLEAIERWVDFKDPTISAFAVARTIAKKGTRIYRNRSLGIELEKKNKALTESMNKEFPAFLRNLVKSNINRAFR